MKISPLTIAIISSVTLGLSSTANAAQHEHDHITVHYEGKAATADTIKHNQAIAQTLNFADTTAFEQSSKNLIAKFDKATADILRAEFAFIGEQTPDSVNPSLYRQAQLNMVPNGLYKVSDGIYQVRGTDLSNLTLIKGDSGWIAYDVLLTKEAAKASLTFALKHLPEGSDLPVVAMIYSHSHADHFGGARGVQEMFPDVKVYGSHNITKEIVDENVLAGNAMSRRAAYQYGATLGKDNHGIVDAALGKGLSKGEITYVAPDYTLNGKGKWETLKIDGLEMVFMDASGTEAESEMITFIPSKNALWSGELTYQGMHNIYTLRGAKVRDALKWSKDINEMITAFGSKVEVLFSAHSAPVWGNEEVNQFLRLQRDNYGLVHNQTLRLANNGVGIQDIGDAIQATIPETVYKTWHTNGYHGTYSHNAKAVYNKYLGYFDMNPANLNPLTTKLESAKFVEYMGGAEATVKRAQSDYIQGEYRFVATALNKVIMADPNNDTARQLLADTYEQLGYQSEGAGWRNIYLTGAQELRVGIQKGAPKTASADVISEMDMPTLFDFLAVKIDSQKAAKHGLVKMNIITPDTKSILYIELSNGNLSNNVVDDEQTADANLIVNKSDVTQILLGKTTLKALLASGDAKITGDKTAFSKIAGSMVEFNPEFEIVPTPKK
ncbi:MBL fold metallo-hydrolase [Shewanella sp. Choline-02u-19]|uniref:alkyl/aryl-sulfatase n=1 Tax=unclassified Shewanella TaxID=196818 RepID=UPI000C32B531|nr:MULTISPECIES: alkyl sulfatase dimerization domain-containing protein [unclassified Shewanella]PKH54912.1 MBL fold metallo-hydrolase [Shewanella sp. Bg11-22]PKI26684.1 MBL fold metallo-hydrolase [Shewanella sp. Choline-02u-19]